MPARDSIRSILAAFAIIALAGCSATVAAGDATKAQAPEALRAEADLAATQAFSATLATQAGQVTRLVDATLEAMRMWQAVTIILAGALVIGVVAAVVVGALAAARATRPRAVERPPVYIIQAPSQAPPVAAPDRAPAEIQSPSVLALLRWRLDHREPIPALPPPDDCEGE
jgi:hypothetical protein